MSTTGIVVCVAGVAWLAGWNLVLDWIDGDQRMAVRLAPPRPFYGNRAMSRTRDLPMEFWDEADLIAEFHRAGIFLDDEERHGEWMPSDTGTISAILRGERHEPTLLVPLWTWTPPDPPSP